MLMKKPGEFSLNILQSIIREEGLDAGLLPSPFFMFIMTPGWDNPESGLFYSIDEVTDFYNTAECFAMQATKTRSESYSTTHQNLSTSASQV